MATNIDYIVPYFLFRLIMERCLRKPIGFGVGNNFVSTL